MLLVRILMTGATGFIGSRLLPLLKDHDVICLTRDAQGLPPRPKVKPLVADLAKPAIFRGELERFAPQWCFHLAWEGLPDYSPARCQANLDAGTALFQMLGEIHIERVAVAGSCWEYGIASGATGEHQAPVDAGDFAASKNTLRQNLANTAAAFGFEYRWARVFFAYGPGQRGGSLIPLSHAAYTRGLEPDIRSPDVAQDFIHVDDVAGGLLALASQDMESGVYNLGTGKSHNVGDVVNCVAAHFGRPAPFPATAPKAGFWADMTKTAQASGWTPAITLDDGIGRSLAALDRMQ